MLTNMFPPKDSLKNIIINILLAEKTECEIKEIKQLIKKHHNKSVTYQGIHKILNQFKEENILIQNEKKWKVNSEWLNQIENIIAEYNFKKTTPIYSPDLEKLPIKTMNEALHFFITNVEADTLRNGGEEVFITHFKNIGLFILSKKERAFLKEFAKRTKCYILIENNNFINRFCAKYFKSLGMEVYIGIPRLTPNSISVYGNTLFNIFYHFDIISYLTNKYKKITSLNTIKELSVFDKLKDDPSKGLTFTFETDKNVVNRMKTHLLQIIKENSSCKV